MASHDLSETARMNAARNRNALPDGSYPIRDRAELAKAIQAFGRVKPEHRAALKALIRRRARELGATDLLGPALST